MRCMVVWGMAGDSEFNVAESGFFRNTPVERGQPLAQPRSPENRRAEPDGLVVEASGRPVISVPTRFAPRGKEITPKARSRNRLIDVRNVRAEKADVNAVRFGISALPGFRSRPAG